MENHYQDVGNLYGASETQLLYGVVLTTLTHKHTSSCQIDALWWLCKESSVTMGKVHNILFALLSMQLCNSIKAVLDEPHALARKKTYFAKLLHVKLRPANF